MSKKTFFKKLLIAGMCVISATATAGIVASCKEDNPNNNQTETQKYTITYNTNIGTKPADVTNTDKIPATLPQLTDPEGKYEFGGWYYNSGLQESSKVQPGAALGGDNLTITLYAKWTPKQTSTVEVTSVTVSGSATVEAGKKITLTATVLPENATDKKVTWAVSAGGEYATINSATGELTGVAAGTVKVTATAGGKTSAEYTVTVTAAPAEVTQYTVTLIYDNGEENGSQQVDENTAFAEPETPVKTGWTFEKWVLVGENGVETDYDFATPVTGDITLKAKYTEDSVEEKRTVTFDMHGIGTAPAAQSVVVGGKATKPETVPSATGYYFIGWYTDDTYATEFDFENTAISADTTIYACWSEDVKVVASHDAAMKAGGFVNSGKLTEPFVYGKLTYGEGMYFQSNYSGGGLSGTIVNTQKKPLYFELGGWGKVSFMARQASADGTVAVYKADGTLVQNLGAIVGNAATYTSQELEAGRYYIQSQTAAGADNAMRVGDLTITERLVVSDADSILVSASNVDYLLGSAFDDASVSVKLHYKNGREDVLDSSKYTIDKTAYNKDASGKYTITIRYKDNAEVAAETIEVFVYKIDNIALSDYTLNSSRVTQNLQKIYNLGGTFNNDGLAVQANCSVTGEDNKTKLFYLDLSQVVIGSVDLTTAGEKTVTVTENVSATDKKTAEYVINVVDLTNARKTFVNVDANATAVSIVENVLTVITINDAVKALQLLGAQAHEVKTIQVAAGEYFEKVEINIPNVQIIGAGTNAGDTVLVFDALAGQLDPAGQVGHSTDGSATISIREGAYGFSAENIEFRNYYNTNPLYEESKAKFSDTQAVAALVQADKVVFNNVRFSSYHDTLYDMYGRHVYENCYIEGRTDYVFGYNSTAYFHNTTLKTIGSNKSAEELTETNGGYVVATKGASKSDGSDAVKYGYIFDGCTFTSDEFVTPGTVSLARGWDKYMTMIVMNSSIDGAYSKEAYGNTESKKNDRYGKMNAAPVASLLLEYNNTGDGAIAESIADTCTVLKDATAAADYANYAKIFAAVNGKLTYTEAWGGNLNLATVEIKTTDGTTVATVYGYVGGTVNNSVLNTAVKSSVPNGKIIDKFTADIDGNVTELGALTATTVVYVHFKDAPVTQTYKLDVSKVPTTESTTKALINDIFYGVNIKQESNKNNVPSYDKQVSLTKGKVQVSNGAFLNGITFTVEEGKTAKVTLIAAQKSDKTTSLNIIGLDGKTANYSNLTINGTPATVFDTLPNTNGASSIYTFELSAGEYALGGVGGGAYVYALTVQM